MDCSMLDITKKSYKAEKSCIMVRVREDITAQSI